MLTVPFIESPKLTVESISTYQQLLARNHFIYWETEEQSFDWIKFAKLITDKELMLQYGQEIFHIKWEPELLTNIKLF